VNWSSVARSVAWREGQVDGEVEVMLLGITPTVHKLVAQNKPELNLSVMN
jgi:hypothetical protein